MASLLPGFELSNTNILSGAMIGSLALNHRFSTAVENLVGPKQWKDLKNSKAFAQALKQFDREIKKEFGVDDGEEEEEFYVTFPMADLDNDPFHELESNTWRMVKYKYSRKKGFSW